jgi:predicted XRE-type DNA-binding protein
MSETRAHDGPEWRENPDEYKPPVRGRGSFLASRGYENPEIAAVKFGLAEDIQRAVARLGSPSQAEVAARVRAAGVPLSQPDVSAILNGNVKAFALERLMQVAAALGTTVTVSSETSKDGVGHVQVRRSPPRGRAGRPKVAVNAAPLS